MFNYTCFHLRDSEDWVNFAQQKQQQQQVPCKTYETLRGYIIRAYIRCRIEMYDEIMGREKFQILSSARRRGGSNAALIMAKNVGTREILLSDDARIRGSTDARK